MGKVIYLPILLCIIFSIIISGAMVGRRLIDRGVRSEMIAIREEGNILNKEIQELEARLLHIYIGIDRALFQIRGARAVMAVTGKKEKDIIVEEDSLWQI